MLRLVFKDRDAKNTLGAICVNNYWFLDAEIRADHDNGVPYELEYFARNGDLRVNYIEDFVAECSYVVLRGESAAADRAAHMISEAIPVWSDEEVLSAWREACGVTDRCLAILRVGVAAPPSYDKPFATCLHDALASDKEDVREAALAAIGYRNWPELDDTLARVARTDKSERCANRASVMLEIRQGERST